jgi:hypothetical protein
MNLVRIGAHRSDSRSSLARISLRLKVIALALIGTPLFVLGQSLVEPPADTALTAQGETLAARMMAPREPPPEAPALAAVAPIDPAAAERSAETTAAPEQPNDAPALVPLQPAASTTEAAEISEIIPAAAMPVAAAATPTLRAVKTPRSGLFLKREFSDGTILWKVKANQKVVKSVLVKSLADAALFAKKIRATQVKRADGRARTAG